MLLLLPVPDMDLVVFGFGSVMLCCVAGFGFGLVAVRIWFGYVVYNFLLGYVWCLCLRSEPMMKKWVRFCC